MAKQRGMFKLEGTIGDVTFYKSGDGYIAKEKTVITKERIATDPRFKRTRENNSEFARAGKASKLLRSGLRGLLYQTADKRMVGRLTRVFVAIIRMDAVNPRGQRNIIDGEILLLEGFEFNIHAALHDRLSVAPVITVDRVAGTVIVAIPAFVPLSSISYPEGATHYSLTMAALEADFEQETSVTQENTTVQQPLDSTATAPLSETLQLTAGSTHPIVVAVGIRFFQEVNGVMYALNNEAFNALSVVKTDA